MQTGLRFAAALAAAAIAVPAAAQERTAVKNGFDLTSAAGKALVDFRSRK
jgi:hypothetical protein